MPYLRNPKKGSALVVAGVEVEDLIVGAHESRGGQFGDAGGVVSVLAAEFLQQVRQRVAKLNQTLGGNGDLRTTTLIPSGEEGRHYGR